MKTKSLNELEECYDLELASIAEKIKNQKPKPCKVLLQFPDGLKPYATQIQEKLVSLLAKDKKSPEILIYLDTCFGACDLPLEAQSLGVDLIIQFGHSPWNYSKRKDINVLK